MDQVVVGWSWSNKTTHSFRESVGVVGVRPTMSAKLRGHNYCLRWGRRGEGWGHTH